MGQGTGQELSSMYQAFPDSDKLKVTSKSRTQVVLRPVGACFDQRLPEASPTILHPECIAPSS